MIQIAPWEFAVMMVALFFIGVGTGVVCSKLWDAGKW